MSTRGKCCHQIQARRPTWRPHSFSTNFKRSFHGRLPWLRPIVQSGLVGTGAGFVRADAARQIQRSRRTRGGCKWSHS
ncbi:uncharacterized protein BDW47DRAFT_105283 [Aspergillus candidus]|uniref:Uncharacterized protein n=1 Tax=Aspergillus candidus TaxID=41067 RepID=A0A2I2FCL5_ASPCN|nr:hypothetical protein BDW47DRAFT_105283 [Aspergillus candidus]PLB38373.1 hypothetical protein BDW47DRAFT_105283 [Aspergillus candidus]